MTDVTINDLQKAVDRIQKSLIQILVRESDDDAEKKWLIEHTSNPEIKQIAPHLSILGLHVLEVIFEKEGIKGIDIAGELKVTKGAVSKVTRKLLDHGLIRKVRRPTNLKEIYYYVTSLGAELADLHRQMHKEKDRIVFELLQDYDKKCQEQIIDFMEKLAQLR
ncbi:MarR family transcriptional regulator [Lutispora thermophila]|uniref:DNA-binding transcriptional regulator, MarR family n=1 Tax=Lutispora thermophila DSM 19022 TaxID=1122184 RepID=A0A1M6AX98_9FIRM|nr:MarR family transcriptional regulator [Lutispora thermophila]SHI41067.1 DNA-binding transcriptional regulator, MarR family [Lutispora thermophila DSM 19022]